MADPSKTAHKKRDVAAAPSAQEGARAPSHKTTLDDVMIAMDVVDTLRHDKRIVERELDIEPRRAGLIERLKKIYAEQGIDVPDRLLEEGVLALEQDRFLYEPPKDRMSVRLARLYVRRNLWGRWLIGGFVGILFVLGGWYFAFERPRQNAIENLHVELTQTLPAAYNSLTTKIKSLVDGKPSKTLALRRAKQLAEEGHEAAKAQKQGKAREKHAALQQLLSQITLAYQVRIVTRRGALSGLWRVPKINPSARNYYLIVEAIGADGKPLTLGIRSEETGKLDQVKKWGQRVPKSVLDKVQRDKADDGIIQDNIMGEKRQGALSVTWRVNVHKGAITKWERR